MALPKTTQDRITQEAQRIAKGMWPDSISKYAAKKREEVEAVYELGATAEAERAQKLIEAMEAARLKMHWVDNDEERDILARAIQQWNAGKEVENGGE